jgi:sugar phosphate isomerase/epimerase
LGRPLLENGSNTEFVKFTKRSIEAAGYLGIPNIVVHTGYLPNISKEENFRRNKIFYEELLALTEKYDINILAENFDKMRRKDYYWIDSAEDLNEFVDFVNHPHLKVCWDTGHGNMQTLPQHEALKVLGKKVAALHVQDNMGYHDDHIIPFLGTLNIDSLMNGLKEINYDGYFTFEATNIPFVSERRKKTDYNEICSKLPVEFRKKFELILYDIGKFVLTQYACFDE